MARIYYAKHDRLNIQTKYEGVQITELGYEVPAMKGNLLEVTHPANYDDDEKETWIKEEIAKIDNIQRKKWILLPIKAEKLCYRGGHPVDSRTPTPLEAFLMAASPMLDVETKKPRAAEEPKFKKFNLFKTNLKNVLYEEVPAGTPYSIDVEKIFKAKQSQPKANDEEVSRDDEGNPIKIVGKKIGKKRKMPIAV